MAGYDTGLRPAAELAFSAQEFDRIAAFVHAHSGIMLGRHKKPMVYSRLVRRVRARGLGSFRDYLVVLQDDPGERHALINAITTNLTKFYREAHHFEHFESIAIPRMLATRPARGRLRIWSAGCSTGEEPYSIAMILAGLSTRLARWDAKILATDLDTSVLSVAKAALYPDDALDSLPPRFRHQCFERASGSGHRSARVIEPVRSLVTFKPLNLLAGWPMKGPFDAIFCRNVMIYFDGPTKQRLVERFASLLKPDGWLYVGHSEVLLDHQSVLSLDGRTVYRRIGDAS